ncbi:hypothetical protein HK100_004950 [Physocladia obscura]|uniref:SH3 domain-containing protein n=1 Tax=Physocladia obscura TaxID=109957 RepID=A0AAD5SXV4_9FUNG|nr:hypothetical protein HK100_004950 [Physocladia obscura]
MPPSPIFDKNDGLNAAAEPYPGFKPLESIIGLIIPSTTAEETATDSVDPNTHYLQVSAIIGVVAVVIVGSALLFIKLSASPPPPPKPKLSQTAINKERMEQAKKNYHQYVQEQNEIRKSAAKIALPPLVFQASNQACVNPPPLLALNNKIKRLYDEDSSGGGPAKPDIYYNSQPRQDEKTSNNGSSSNNFGSLTTGSGNRITRSSPNLNNSSKKPSSLLRHCLTSSLSTFDKNDGITKTVAIPPTPPREENKPPKIPDRASSAPNVKQQQKQQPQILSSSQDDELNNSVVSTGARTSRTSVSDTNSSVVLRYKVEKPWTPQKPDELVLRVGDVAHVVRVFNDAWCEGFIETFDGDVEGFFPRDCLCELPLSLWELQVSNNTVAVDSDGKKE